MTTIETIRTRRDGLAEKVAQAQQEYAQVEQMLVQLDRQICAMHDGVQELDALLLELEAQPQPSQEA